jgi:hypothetical protein
METDYIVALSNATNIYLCSLFTLLCVRVPDVFRSLLGSGSSVSQNRILITVDYSNHSYVLIVFLKIFIHYVTCFKMMIILYMLTHSTDVFLLLIASPDSLNWDYYIILYIIYYKSYHIILYTSFR